MIRPEGRAAVEGLRPDLQRGIARRLETTLGKSPWVKVQLVPPVNIRFNPTTKIGPKMGGEFTYPKKLKPNGFDHSQMCWPWVSVYLGNMQTSVPGNLCR